MSIRDVLKLASLNLRGHCDEPYKSAVILICYYLKLSREDVILKYDMPIRDSDGFFELVNRLKEQEPIEYITNRVCFYSKDFFIQSGVFIPRPETEILVDIASKHISKNSKFKICEIGCGSGVLSIMLAHMFSNVEVLGIDISSLAIDNANKNANLFKVENRVKFIKLSYKELLFYDDYDIIISNPPYICDDYKLCKKLTYEPREAFFGGEVGYEMLIDIVKFFLSSRSKYLICEIGYDQKAYMESFFKQNHLSSYKFYKDLNSLDRAFILNRLTRKKHL